MPHAPGHIRDRFEELVDQEVLFAEMPRWLLGRLWNCTDCMPRSLCAMLDMPQGSTYAQAVRGEGSLADLMRR